LVKNDQYSFTTQKGQSSESAGFGWINIVRHRTTNIFLESSGATIQRNPVRHRTTDIFVKSSGAQKKAQSSATEQYLNFF
jgi:hypothetical protein